MKRSDLILQIKGAAFLLSFAVLSGLIAARVLSFGQEPEYFSLMGFIIGFGVALPLCTGFIVGITVQTTPLQRRPIRAAFFCLLAALELLTIFLYTGWHWAKIAAACAGAGMVLGVFGGVLVIALGPRHEA